MKIYVCGGSSELDAVADRIRQLRELDREITHDWVAVIRSIGEFNPRSASHEQRLEWSDGDLLGIEKADIVWVVLPVKPSFGCAFEMGFAIGIGCRVIVSGDWRASIFTAQAFACFDKHDSALDWIAGRVV
jgi:hypothetical protein